MSPQLLVFIYLKRGEGGGSQFTLLPTFFWYGIHRLKRGYDFRLMLFMLKSLKVWPFFLSLKQVYRRSFHFPISQIRLD